MNDLLHHTLEEVRINRLVMSGIDLPTVKELMGHKDITMTLRSPHPSSDHKQNAVRALDNFGIKLRRFSRQGEHDTDTGSSK